MRGLSLLLVLAACKGTDDWTDHGAIADGIMAPLGEPLPSATPEQRELFTRGLAVGERRFRPSEGLGPAFNVSFCLGCHEKPTFGGSAGLYRSFFLSGRLTADGAFQPGESAGDGGGVIRLNHVGTDHLPRPEIPETTTILAQRNPIPFYGVGLLAEIPDEEILRRADPDDEDGDGISGKPNYDRGFVGRFGRKAQTVSIEGFIRGPLFNHLGITTDPLTDQQRALLPVDSSSEGDPRTRSLVGGLFELGQAAAPDGPLVDDDPAPDPEMSSEALFELVSYSMLLAAPLVDEPTPQTEQGRLAFNEARCTDCHTPRLEGPRGPLHVYSDLLLHDMGPELADGLVQKDATGAEFRTQPLWGIASVGPYLHDGRAMTLHDAILAHGGEASASQSLYAGFDADRQADLRAFLVSLGGADQFTPGLVAPDAPVPAVGEWGGPVTADDEERFRRGREAFDFEFNYAEGVGGPRFNGDSCRACHFEPVVGGAGPLDLNVMRHGLINAAGDFVTPEVGTILHRLRRVGDGQQRAQPGTAVYEMRQTPHLFGLGLVDAIPAATILANADPDDADGDGISGRPSFTDDGRLGRFGWKGSVPSVREFVRDGITMELGLTLPFVEELTFGRVQDNDDVPDPEVDPSFIADVEYYLSNLGPPPRSPAGDPAAATRGEAVFTEVGCASCHVPVLQGDRGPVPLYSDLLLHAVLPPGSLGIEEASATMEEFRTAPLWGVGRTAPYLHHGLAETLDDAVRAHDGEARAVRDAFIALPDADRAALLAFLETL
jgi:CxxC motif-containing protein (DUF1111 family)